MSKLANVLQPVKFKQAESNTTEINTETIIEDSSVKTTDITEIINAMIQSDKTFSTDAIFNFKIQIQRAFNITMRNMIEIKDAVKQARTLNIEYIIHLARIDMLNINDVKKAITKPCEQTLHNIQKTISRLNEISTIIEDKTRNYSFNFAKTRFDTEYLLKQTEDIISYFINDIEHIESNIQILREQNEKSDTHHNNHFADLF